MTPPCVARCTTQSVAYGSSIGSPERRAASGARPSRTTTLLPVGSSRSWRCPCRDETRARALPDVQPFPLRGDAQAAVLGIHYDATSARAGGQLGQPRRQRAAGAEQLIAIGSHYKTKLNPGRTGNCLPGQRGSQSTTAIQPRQAAHSDIQQRIAPAYRNRQQARRNPLTSRDGGIRTRGLLLPN